jgi:hypothetical protein
VESHNQKKKMVLNRTKTITEAIRGLLDVHSRKNAVLTYQRFDSSVKMPYLNSKHRTKEMEEVNAICTKFATELILKEIVGALDFKNVQATQRGLSVFGIEYQVIINSLSVSTLRGPCV